MGTPEQWCRQLYAAAHDLLHQYVGGGAAAPAAAARLQRRAAAAVFAAGEAALLRAARPPAGLTVLLQALTAPKLLPGMAAMTIDDVTADAGAGAEPDGDAGMADAAGAEGGGEGAEAAAPAVAGQVPAALQGHAWIGLGKVCLVDEALAKKLVPLFIQVGAGWLRPAKRWSVVRAHARVPRKRPSPARPPRGDGPRCWSRASPRPWPRSPARARHRGPCSAPRRSQELGRSPSPVVRNNIMVALSDMVITYTALVSQRRPWGQIRPADAHGAGGRLKRPCWPRLTGPSGRPP